MRSKFQSDSQRRRAARRKRGTGRVATSDRVRLVVYRSARHMYALLVEPHTGRTLTSVSTRTPEVAGEGATGNIDAARRVGAAIAERARARNIDEVVFHRNGFLYHGRVKALADAAREAGLKF